MQSRALLLVFLPVCVLSDTLVVDLGSQFFKAAVVGVGKFEIVHNMQSQRKTPTAVSFRSETREFGDAAILAWTKSPDKVPVYFRWIVGANSTVNSSESLYPHEYAPFSVVQHERRQSAVLHSGGAVPPIESEVLLSHILSYAKHLAEVDPAHASVPPLKDITVTIPSWASQRERQAIIDAANTAGFTRATLVHETTAAAVQRALDIEFPNKTEGLESIVTVFVNMGAAHLESCVIKYNPIEKKLGSSVSVVPMVSILGCSHSLNAGGVAIDKAIANEVAELFVKKYPKKSAGFKADKSAKARLLLQAEAVKRILSANKDAVFSVEGLYDEIDFRQPITRSDIERFAKPVMHEIDATIRQSLKNANVSMDHINQVELIGGAWRVPCILNFLGSEIFKGIEVGQHLNGEEAMVFGAAYLAANNSAQIQIRKKVVLSDIVSHNYSIVLDVTKLAAGIENEKWPKTQLLFPVGHRIGSQKAVRVSSKSNLVLTIFEDSNLIDSYEISGIEEFLQTEKYKNLENSPIPSLSIRLKIDHSGILVLVGVEASVVQDSVSSKNVESSNEEHEEGMNDEKSTSVQQPSSQTNETANVTSKPKISRIKIPVTFTNTKAHPMPMTSDDIQHSQDYLYSITKKENEAHLRLKTKVEFESFIYSSRDKVENDRNVQSVSQQSDRELINKQLSEDEEWLYGDGHDASTETYKQRLDALKSLLQPILERSTELNARIGLNEFVNAKVDQINSTINEILANRSWVDKEQVYLLGNQTSNFTKWFKNVSAIQSNLAPTENPAFKVSDVKKRVSALTNEAARLKRIRYIPPKMPQNTSSDGDRYNFSDPDLFNNESFKEFIKNYTVKSGDKNETSIEDAAEWIRLYKDMMKANSTRQDTNSTRDDETAEPAKDEL